MDFRLDRGRPSRRSKTGSGPNRIVPLRASIGEIAPDFGDSDDADRTGVWTLSRPSLARVVGYDLMDGGDDLINAVRHGPRRATLYKPRCDPGLKMGGG